MLICKTCNRFANADGSCGSRERNSRQFIERSVVPRRARQETEIWREKENVGGTNSTKQLRLDAHESRRK
jgi:hypothetical protein